MKSSLYPQISFLVLLCLLTAVLQSSYSLPTTSDQHDTVQNSASESAREEKDKDQAPSSSSDGTSLVNVVIPAAYEVQVENIKSCEPTVTLSNGKKKDIASYITANYDGACLDTKLFLELSARGVLKKVLERDDKKADTIICHEFVELLNAVELEGLTKTMCAEGVLSQVSDEFCTSDEQTPQFKTHIEAVVGELVKRDLSQIATGFLLLGKIRSDDRCLHMCGGDDKVFCNAYVRLTEFFLEPSSSSEPEQQQQQQQQDVGGGSKEEEDKEEPPPINDAPQPSKQDNSDTLFDKLKIELEGKSVSDLQELRATIEDGSERVFRYKLHEVFPFMPRDQLDVAARDKEVMKFILDSVIKKHAKSQAQTFESNNSPSFGDQDRIGGSLTDFENNDLRGGTINQDGSDQSDRNNDDITTLQTQKSQNGQANNGYQAENRQLGPDHEDEDDKNDNDLITQLDENSHREVDDKNEIDDQEAGDGDGRQILPDENSEEESHFDQLNSLFSSEEFGGGTFLDDNEEDDDEEEEKERNAIAEKFKEYLRNEPNQVDTERSPKGQQQSHQINKDKPNNQPLSEEFKKPQDLIGALAKENEKESKENKEEVLDGGGYVEVDYSSKKKSGSSYGSWHFLSIFLFLGACVVIGYVFITKKKKIREGIGSYIANGSNKQRKRVRDYRPLRST